MPLNKEVLEVAAVWEGIGDADKYKFTVVIWREGDEYYRTEIPERVNKENVDLDAIPKPPIPMDMTQFRGAWNSRLSEVSAPLLAVAYVKTPSLMNYSDRDDKPGDDMILEAEILEFMKEKGGHPNVGEYYGCVRDGPYVTGLALKQYPKSLQFVMRESKPSLDKRRSFYRGILVGIKFIHDIGLVHNDLNPSNIMIGDDDRPVIIDFDSCTRAGDKSGVKGGTFLWSREYDPQAKDVDNGDVFANDTYSLHLLHNYLFQECPSIDPGVMDDKINWEQHICDSNLPPQ